MKIKAHWTKKKGIALWIMYFIWFIFGYSYGKTEVSYENLLFSIFYFIGIGVLIILFGNKDKRKKK